MRLAGKLALRSHILSNYLSVSPLKDLGTKKAFERLLYRVRRRTENDRLLDPEIDDKENLLRSVVLMPDNDYLQGP